MRGLHRHGNYFSHLPQHTLHHKSMTNQGAFKVAGITTSGNPRQLLPKAENIKKKKNLLPINQILILLGSRKAQFSQRATDLHGHRERAWVLQLKPRDDGDHPCGVILSTSLGHCQLFATVQYFIEIPVRQMQQKRNRRESQRKDHLFVQPVSYMLRRTCGKQDCFSVAC